MTNSTLRIENLVKRFTGVVALKGVTMEAKAGRITGLIGVNGAGKSTLMNILGGVKTKDEGTIYLDGEKIEYINPKEAERSGFGFIHQEPLMFESMTVAENIFVSGMLKKKTGILDYKRMRTESVKSLKLMDSHIKPTTKVENLAIGDKQMVEIARAIHLGGKVLLFDEPTSSLSLIEKAKLFSVMRGLKEQNKIIFFISHFLDEVKEICDDVIVLRDGLVVAQGETKDFTKQMIIRSMIGKDVVQINKDEKKEVGEVVFEVENIKRGQAPDNISFKLHKGETVGIWGLLGSGRTELLRALVGLDNAESGKVRIRIKGKLRHIPFSKLLYNSGFVTENRHDDGLFLPWSVWQNISAVGLREFTSKFFKFINSKNEKKRTLEFVDKLSIMIPGDDAKVEQLSGGNQQKVIMAKWLLKQPGIFFLDEPTKGVDVGSKAEIHRMILQMAKAGTASLVVSSEIEELSLLCDRVLIMNRGKIVEEVKKEDITKERLMTNCV